MSGAFNRQTRRSGGYRPTRFSLPNLSADDLEILKQEAIVLKEFGEEGVRRFWELLPDKDRRVSDSQDEDIMVQH